MVKTTVTGDWRLATGQNGSDWRTVGANISRDRKSSHDEKKRQRMAISDGRMVKRQRRAISDW
ncbi:MAG: hypothetical protein RRB24_02555 [Armatimonadota bacterium]|nr:hypothetical protein [Armatimonadota bacterium]MDT7971689.1 hypothetical protein [Armatimonadota bacterium]